MSNAIVAAYVAGQQPPHLGQSKKPLVETSCVEPVGGWWSNNNAWGYQFTGNFPAALTDVIPVVNNDLIPGPPRMVSISLFRGNRTGSKSRTTPRNAEIYAQIIYGAGGINNTILVDWAQGGQFSLPCTSCRVNAVPFVPDLDEDSGDYRPTDNNGKLCALQVGAVLGINGADPAHLPSITLPYQQKDAGQLLEVDMPEFACKVVPMVGRLAGGDPQVLPTEYRIVCLAGTFSREVQNVQTSDAIFADGMELIGRPATIRLINESPVRRRLGLKFLLRL